MEITRKVLFFNILRMGELHFVASRVIKNVQLTEMAKLEFMYILTVLPDYDQVAKLLSRTCFSTSIVCKHTMV